MKSFLRFVIDKIFGKDHEISFRREFSWTGYRKMSFNHKEFIDFARPFALQVEQQFKIPIVVPITQSAHETRWGNSKLNLEGNNYFGMTVGDNGLWTQTGGAVISYPSTEFSKYPPEKIRYWNRAGDILEKKPDGKGGSILQVMIDFRKYGSPLDSFSDWGRHIRDLYANAYDAALANQPAKFFEEIGRRYGTDSNYTKSCLDTLDEVTKLI